ENQAIATVLAFFDAMNYQIDTGSTDHFNGIVSSYCAKCAQVVAETRSLQTNGNHIQGGHFHVISVDSVYPTDAALISVLVTAREDAGEQLDVSGNILRYFQQIPPTQVGLSVNIETQHAIIQHFYYIGRSS
ncbi:MAG: hypothetical protein K6T28_04005, partial [Acidothermus sp.]|nr:hypothetical protein [Acidothermus sp.]